MKDTADELLDKFAIFSEILEPYYSLNKMVYFRTFVGSFQKWRHTWHYRTARHSQKVGIHAAECQIPSQSRFALINRHFYASLTRTTRWNSRKIVSCVMCDVTTRCQALGVFSENYRKRVILSTLNVNISESQAIFPLKVWHRSACFTL